MILCRRDVMAGAGALAVASRLPAAAHAASFVSKRPAPGKRNFTSPAIEAEIKRVKAAIADPELARSEEHTSELQSLMRISYAVFCLKKKKKKQTRLNRQ